jgi:hypothetical protein
MHGRTAIRTPSAIFFLRLSTWKVRDVSADDIRLIDSANLYAVILVWAIQCRGYRALNNRPVYAELSLQSAQIVRRYVLPVFVP